MNVRYSAKALGNLWAIADVLEKVSPSGASAVAQRIETTVKLIAQYPGAGRIHRRKGSIRRMPVGRYPYTIYYRRDPDAVVILHVRHAKRRAPRMIDLAE
jgi:toxin ParE1/3/4